MARHFIAPTEVERLTNKRLVSKRQFSPK